MFEIYIFVPGGRAATTPTYNTESPEEAAELSRTLKLLFDKGIIDQVYIYFNKVLLESHER